jgi:hypothetical protein
MTIYNPVRPHSRLDYRTPIGFRQHHEFIEPSEPISSVRLVFGV